MKTYSYIFLSLFLLAGVRLPAQGFFDQKGAWIKNQLKQIALWEIYIKDLEKGYKIAQEGLNTISDIKNGEFHLHLDRFNSFAEVNPAIKKYAKALDIVLIRTDIKKLVVKSDDNYVNAVWLHLVNGCDEDVEQLNLLLIPGNYRLTDDERIGQIDKLYMDMKDKYAFAKKFSSDVKICSVQQLKEKNEMQTSRLLNNITP